MQSQLIGCAVFFALIALALAGCAVAYHYLTKSSQVQPSLEIPEETPLSHVSKELLVGTWENLQSSSDGHFTVINTRTTFTADGKFTQTASRYFGNWTDKAEPIEFSGTWLLNGARLKYVVFESSSKSPAPGNAYEEDIFQLTDNYLETQAPFSRERDRARKVNTTSK